MKWVNCNVVILCIFKRSIKEFLKVFFVSFRFVDPFRGDRRTLQSFGLRSNHSIFPNHRDHFLNQVISNYQSLVIHYFSQLSSKLINEKKIRWET